MEEDNHESYESMEEESQEDYESMDEDSQDSYEEMEDEVQDSNAAMEVESVGGYSSTEERETRSDNMPLMDDEDSNNTNSNVWVYAKHLQTPGAFQQVCLGQWAPNDFEELKESNGPRKLAHVDVVLGKGSYISLCRFTEYEADYPSGSWEVIHEQPVFGTIKDLKSVSINFEDELYDPAQDTDSSCYKRPRMGYLPELASKSLLVATCNNGFLTFLAFHYDRKKHNPEDRGHFYAVKKIDIIEPGQDLSEMGANIALDPTCNVMAVSGLQGHVKLFFLRKTKRSNFDPVEMISSVEVKGTVMAMDFLYVDQNATLVTAILGVLYFNKISGRYYISTFHIGPTYLDQEPPIYVGTSEIGSNHLLSVLQLKGLPDLPYCMVYVDHGHGSILGVKEEEGGTIGVFAISELSNDAPVLDFCANEPALPGRDSLFVCSGMKSEGCIKRVRSGILVESSGSSGQQLFGGATAVWSVKAKRKDPFDSYLVVSFIQSTKLMRVSEQGEFEDVSYHCGLELSQATLAAGRLTDGALFQVHRAGVVVACPRTGNKYEWTPGDGVLASASWAKEGTLVLGQISSGGSNLIVLELVRRSGASKTEAKAKLASYSFAVIASKLMNAEPTTIYCWTSSNPIQPTKELDDFSTEVLCCVGTLEPAVYVFDISQETIKEVFTESLAQGRQGAAVPHSISVLRNSEGLQRILVGLRNGSLITYEWNQSTHPDHSFSSPSIPGRSMSLPRLFNLGIMPVKFAYSDEPLLSSTLILSDKIWHASFNSGFEVQPVLFDNETPRRLLEITSEGLLLAASVEDGFPFAESLLQLIDPTRVSIEQGSEMQHVVAELSRGLELMEEWAMDMSLPAFAISPFLDRLIEKATARERWPIVQISTQGKMIVTGSRGESINFYEYEAGNGEHSFDKLKFFRSARSARQVSDCLAISPESAVGVDLSGSIFGVGYTPGVVNQQYSLVDQFSFHVGEIVNRIRLAKLWLDDGRSLSGVPLPHPVSEEPTLPPLTALTCPPSFVSLLMPFILIPWSPFDNSELSNDITTSPTKGPHPSPQALIGYSLVGSIIGFWRLTPQLYDILKTLQHVMATYYESQPVLGGSHGTYRSQNQPTKAFHTIDGDLIDRFLGLDHAVQIEVVDRAIRLEGMVEEWIRNCDVDIANAVGSNVLAAALEREFRTTICSDDHATGRKCVAHINIRRSLYLNDKERLINIDHLEGDDDVDEESHWEQEDGRPIDIFRVPCRAIHVLCSVLLFLRNLDWHQ
ncbi:hypothetical protein BG015_006027 [Linnemannia schmuckeri]|uniref:Cleavage/polyadenylation specificity factor A subunit N-terminal domain-containing protein n=1 Tax=Linnemannia schmuckeri TaxID=64567 RepID=A0A9P5S0M0_9FUNG|nr:hypothetical protein BG015_006027 [Linnemannia schmuckeri]